MRPFSHLLRTALSLGVLCTMLIAASPSFASAPANDAQGTLKLALDDVFATLNDPRYSDGANREEMLSRIEHTVAHIFDYDEFAARTVGKKWRSFTPDQRTRFSNAFADLLRATYLERIKGYTGNGISYTGQRASTKGDKVEVQTLLDYDGKSVPVDYRLLHKERWVIYDVIIEGVSLVKNYRTQFQELMTDAKIDTETLIQRVQDRAAEVRKQNGKTE